MARTLIFNFDGTGNEPSDAGAFAEDESISNVLKLHVLMGGGLESGETGVETPDGGEQRVFYYNGIGTREGSLRIPLLGVFETVAAMDGIHRKGEKISTDVVFENGTCPPRFFVCHTLRSLWG